MISEYSHIQHVLHSEMYTCAEWLHAVRTTQRDAARLPAGGGIERVAPRVSVPVWSWIATEIFRRRHRGI